MVVKQIALKITNFQDGINNQGTEWKIEKRLFDGEQTQLLHSAALTGESIRFSIEGPARSGWSFEAKVTEKNHLFQFGAQDEQKHFDLKRKEKLAKEAAELKPYSFITIGNKSAVVSHVRSDGTFQIVYEQSPGKHIAEDVRFDGEKYVFCISGPCGSYADNNPHYAPFVSALKRRNK